MADSDGQTQSKVSRRRYLEGLALASAVGVAGCSGGGGSGGDGGGSGGDSGGSSGGSDGGSSGGDTETASSGSAGERVPTFEIEYWSDMGAYTRVFESSVPGIVNNLEEGIGLSVESIPVAFTTQINNCFQDKRTHHMSYWTHSLSPDRLDPFEFCHRFRSSWAGNNGSGNPANYANCDHSRAATAQAVATSESERREAVANAHGQMSENLGSIPLATVLRFGAYNSNQIEANSLGNTGMLQTGYRAVVESAPTGDTGKVANVNPVMTETSTHMVINSTGSLALWNHVIYSTLMEYNENYELENVLAEDYTVENDGQTITVNLRDDVTFHDGESITAEDVKFTFEFISENTSEYPKGSSPPYDSIDVVDETTVRFNMTEPYLPLITRIIPRWGILPKHVWENNNAAESPRNVDFGDTGVVGSGPYQVENFQQGSFIELSPHDGTPLEPAGDLTLQVYQDAQSAFRAFSAEELNMVLRVPAGIANEIRNNVDFGEVVNTTGFLPYVMYPQYSWGPAMFDAFREAFSQAIDRNAMIQTALFGDSEPMLHSSPVAPPHPWYTGEDNLRQQADSASANPETARSILTDAGWSFDDQDRLHYPSDADLTPRWPEGDEPADYPDQFPCVEELSS